MATGGGILTQLLMGHAQRKREGELIDLADKKRKQETQGKYFLQEAENPSIADEDRQGIRQLAIESMSTPLKTYDPAKFGKRYSDIMLQSHDRKVGIADQNAAQTPEPITFQLPQGLLGNPMPPAPPPGQQALPNGGMPMAAAPNPILQRLQQFGYMPPGPPPPPAGEPPQMQGNAAPNPAGTPGMLTQTGMEGLHAPGSNVPGAVRPFIDPQRQMQAAVSQLNALGINDPRDIVNAINKHPLTTPPARIAQIDEIAFMGYLQKADGDPTKAFEMFQKQLHPATSSKESTAEMQAYDALVQKTGDPVEAFRQIRGIMAETKAPAAMSAAQEKQDAIIRSVASRAGVKLDESKPLMAQLPVALQPAAVKAITDTEQASSILAGQQAAAEARRAAEANRLTARSDASYKFSETELGKLSAPIDTVAERMSRLNTTLAQNNIQADALVAPELLSIMAGGQGSGLRMNEAEISRVLGGRTQWEKLKADIQKWSLNPATARSITPVQQSQIHALVSEVQKRVTAQQEILTKARGDLVGSDDPKEHRKIISSTRAALSGLNTSTAPPNAPVPTVTTQAEYDALPSGTFFMQAGQRRKKP